jgi:hypothetical protein
LLRGNNTVELTEKATCADARPRCRVDQHLTMSRFLSAISPLVRGQFATAATIDA